MHRFLVATVSFLVVAAPASLAEPRTISQLSSARGVTISGTATDVFGNAFVLKDATGTALVETGPAWFKQRNFRVGEQLSVTGVVDGGSFDAWRIVRGDGSVETIRNAEGPPPWAGKRRER
jgi:hypothetical protein